MTRDGLGLSLFAKSVTWDAANAVAAVAWMKFRLCIVDLSAYYHEFDVREGRVQRTFSPLVTLKDVGNCVSDRALQSPVLDGFYTASRNQRCCVACMDAFSSNFFAIQKCGILSAIVLEI